MILRKGKNTINMASTGKTLTPLAGLEVIPEEENIIITQALHHLKDLISLASAGAVVAFLISSRICSAMVPAYIPMVGTV